MGLKNTINKSAVKLLFKGINLKSIHIDYAKFAKNLISKNKSLKNDEKTVNSIFNKYLSTKIEELTGVSKNLIYKFIDKTYGDFLSQLDFLEPVIIRLLTIKLLDQ